ADNGRPPTQDDLVQLLKDHDAEGLRYVAIYERGRLVGTAGTPVSDRGWEPREGRRDVSDVGQGRLRVESRMRLRSWAGMWGMVIELEPVQAQEVHGAASRTLMIGSIAALTILGVAIVLVRRELRRQADERARERERRLASLGEMSAIL